MFQPKRILTRGFLSGQSDVSLWSLTKLQWSCASTLVKPQSITPCPGGLNELTLSSLAPGLTAKFPKFQSKLLNDIHTKWGNNPHLTLDKVRLCEVSEKSILDSTNTNETYSLLERLLALCTESWSNCWRGRSLNWTQSSRRNWKTVCYPMRKTTSCVLLLASIQSTWRWVSLHTKLRKPPWSFPLLSF